MTDLLSNQQLQDGGFVPAPEVDLGQFVHDPDDPELVTDKDGKVFRVVSASSFQQGVKPYLRLDPVTESGGE